jgi:hypothetical protein
MSMLLHTFIQAPAQEERDKRVEKVKRNSISQQPWHMITWSRGS